MANVILAGAGDDSDDAEEFLVEEKPKDQLDLIAEASANTTQADVSNSGLIRECGYAFMSFADCANDLFLFTINHHTF